MPRRRSWTGRLFLGMGRLLYAGAVAPTTAHAHHSFQIIVALGGTVALSDGHGNEKECAHAFIPPDVEHAITRPLAAAIMLYVDPDGIEGRRLRRGAPTGAVTSWAVAATRIASVRPASLPAQWNDAAAVEDMLLRNLMEETTRPMPVHPALIRATRAIERDLNGRIRLARLADDAGLSPSRLQHLFSQQVGIPLRRYVLWRRMEQAGRALAVGASLTDAAHAAGFTDSAHMNHAFRRMFGLAPSDVLDAVEWVLPT